MIKRIKLRTNATISSLIKKDPNGTIREYLLRKDSIDKNNRIVFFANQIQKETSGLLSIESKYKYGFRNVRIEIALFNTSLFLIKVISDFKKIDKEALKLDAIINDMKSNYENIIMLGCIILDCDNINQNVIMKVDKLLDNRFIFISGNDIKDTQIFKSLTVTDK